MKEKVKFFDRIEEWLTVALLVVALIVLSYQVFLRFVMNSGNSWSEELARYLFIWSVYTSASFAIISNAHIRIDAVLKLYPKAIRRFIPILADTIFLIYSLIITYYSADYCMDLVASGQVSMGLHVTMGYMYAAIPVGHLMMSVRLVQLIYRRVRHPEKYAV